jgi:hypothetical protein
MPTKSPIQHTALSTNQVAVLRKLVKDASFRTDFLKEPKAAVSKAGIALPSNELAVVSKVTAAQIEGLQTLVGPGRLAADGTNTMLYALAFAVIVALLLAMPNPMETEVNVA